MRGAASGGPEAPAGALGAAGGHGRGGAWRTAERGLRTALSAPPRARPPPYKHRRRGAPGRPDQSRHTHVPTHPPSAPRPAAWLPRPAAPRLCPPQRQAPVSHPVRRTMRGWCTAWRGRRRSASARRRTRRASSRRLSSTRSAYSTRAPAAPPSQVRAPPPPHRPAHAPSYPRPRCAAPLARDALYPTSPHTPPLHSFRGPLPAPRRLPRPQRHAWPGLLLGRAAVAARRACLARA